MLLGRDEFRHAVLKRDGSRCVICSSSEYLDAHHIIERRLFQDGGYYIDNGATLCQEHHLAAEMTILSTENIREAAHINNIVLPPHLYPDERYDKWGNIFLPNGLRARGELFDDESVQKILAHGKVLDNFTFHAKYPRTYHLPWSPGTTKDDRIIEDCSAFIGKEIIVTEKLDGENTTISRDYIHARSIDSRHHASRSWVKNLRAKIAHDIPEHWIICGENLYAQHSIAYDNLSTYFYVFSIWNEKNMCLSWDETIEYLALLDLTPVPVLYSGLWNEELLRVLHKSIRNGCECEGYVVRIRDAFHYRDFRKSVAKYVRASHVSSHGFWHSNWSPNKLKTI